MSRTRPRTATLSLGVMLAATPILLSGCGGPDGTLDETASGAESANQTAAMNPDATAPSEWQSLVVGDDLSQWRGYGRPDVPASWTAEGGTLGFAAGGDRATRGDLMTREQYADFELQLEWRISEGGNSGIMFRVAEGEPQSWHTGPEIQVLDDERHSDGRIPSHRAGALYDLVVPPAGVARPVGEWNEARLEACGARVRHWLNGQLTFDIEIGGDEWSRLYAESKFRDMAGFGAHREGHIVLQDHADPVWYRNIRIRRLSC